MTRPAHPTNEQIGLSLQVVHHLAQVDASAYTVIEEWAYLLAVIASAITKAEAGAAWGTGQADIRTFGRFGDPVLARLAELAWPTHIRDEERAWLAKIRTSAVGTLSYHSARVKRELEPWLAELEREQAG